MLKGISGRTWVSIITVAFLALVLYLARHEIEKAYNLLDQVNLWILLLLIPLQFVSYYAAGEMIFAYLKRQKHIKNISNLTLPRLALEMNFVNHVLPSGGVSGISYMGWRLKHYGVSASRSTAAQLVRMVSAFLSFGILLLLAIVLMAIDGNINRWVVGSSIGLVVIMGGAMLLVMYLLNHKERVGGFARRLTSLVNTTVRLATFGRVGPVMKEDAIRAFFEEVRDDYTFIRKNLRVLVVPFLWGLVFNVVEVAMFYVSFLALGHPVNPAPLVIAYGLAGLAGFFMVTPGGAGAYEAIMVAFLTVAGIPPGIALLAILLTRVLLMLGTIAAGYLFYQQAILTHGKQPVTRV
ncbi:flippase-like domain-containing protein [Candidatus Mycosynbacter amalyticus]|uniref:Flippase-like domain-containing protein n=1 Tax=Candidatus Mycosynbacter amalyticus TaxID=2665156 RepID=A0A857MSZ1_9BACT|nr:lysylphosphatidylglycerol synthase transmembrane domain-containing protein [Candidatus Mycosynbacter amalyticus]QHN42557.1 flippase-like domain-containing protein [Candidatus Mycosynbacter amalyticus]